MTRRSYPHLVNAPIVEAVIDFRVSGTNSNAIDGLRKVCDQMSSGYPKCENLNQIQAQVHFSVLEAEQKLQGSHRPFGFRLTSADGKHVAMLTVEGFTVSRLRPYDRWESLRDEAKRLWELYRRGAEPKSISRIGLRYINRLNLPAIVRDFRDYLTAPPDVPPRLSQNLMEFNTRIVIPVASIGAAAAIIQKLTMADLQNVISRMQQRQTDLSLPVLLDIDVFKPVEFSPESSDVWDLAEKMRHEKNVIFFESITEEMENLCAQR